MSHSRYLVSSGCFISLWYLDFDFIECGKEVREHELYSGYDEDLKCHILDEDKLLDHIEVSLLSVCYCKSGPFVPNIASQSFFQSS